MTAQVEQHPAGRLLLGRSRVPILLVWLAIGLIFAVDALGNRYNMPLLLAAATDLPAHAATGVLLFAAFRLPPLRSLFNGALLGAVFIDLDHIPHVLGWDILQQGTNRPYSHSLAMIAVLLVLATLGHGDWRQLAFGAAFGLATHLLRDMATGSVPLDWPLNKHAVSIPYDYYASLLLAVAGLIIWRYRSESPP